MSGNEAARYIESANKCHGCGEQPMIQKSDHPLNGPSYEMGCKACHMYTGSWETPDEAAIKWNEINPKGEKVHKDEVYQKYIDEARRCSVCGKPPIIARYNGYQMYAPTHYSFDCKECARTTGPLTTILAAKTEWNKFNSVAPPLEWSYEGSKVLATKKDPPKDRYLHYEGRISELSNAIHDRLEWMVRIKQCGTYSAVITLSDWNYLEDWAAELLETIRYRKAELL